MEQFVSTTQKLYLSSFYNTYRHVEEAVCKAELLVGEGWKGVLLRGDRILVLLLRGLLAAVEGQMGFDMMKS